MTNPVHSSRTTIILTSALALALGACSSGGPPPPAVPPPAFTALGISAPYLSGDVIGGRAARAAKMRAAKILPLRQGAAPAYMSNLAGELRRQTAGIGIDVLQLPGSVVVRIPSTLTFNSGSADIAPQIRATFHEIARTLKTRPQTFVDVLAHTDTTGQPATNKALSDRRANAVAAFLGSDGIAKARLAARGMGESAPLYNPDETDEQKAANRRVEIRLVPYSL